MISQPEHPSVTDMLRHAAAAWRPFRGLALGILAVLVLQQVFSTGLALSLKLIVDGLVSDRAAPLPLIIGALAVGYLLAAGATLLGEYLSSIATARIVNNIRRQLFAHLQLLSLDFFLFVPLFTESSYFYIPSALLLSPKSMCVKLDYFQYEFGG